MVKTTDPFLSPITENSHTAGEINPSPSMQVILEMLLGITRGLSACCRKRRRKKDNQW